MSISINIHIHILPIRIFPIKLDSAHVRWILFEAGNKTQ